MASEIRLPDIGDFKDVPIIEIARQTRPERRQGRHSADAGERQGDARGAGPGGRRDRRDQGQGRRQGEPGRPAGDLRERRPAAPAPRRAAPPSNQPAAAAAPAPAAEKSDLECDVLVLGAGPGGYTAAFRAADLGQNVVLVERRPDARRRLPQRRLHSLEGAAACRQGDRRSRAYGCARRRLRQAELRPRQAARLQGRRRQAPDRRPHGARQTAQGDGRHRRGEIHLRQHARRRDGGGPPRRAFRQGDHRRRLRAGRAGLHPAGQAHLGLDRRARPGLRAEAHAGARRRHHRARNGDRL